MDGVRLGSVLRAVRRRKRWRQLDVAHAAGVSRQTVSRLERGHLDELSIRILLTIAAALEIRLDLTARWRGGELDRLIHAGHSALHEAAAQALDGLDWVLAPETTFAIYGDTPSNRRRLRAHATVLRNAFPADGRQMRAWLRHPVGAISALGFLSDARTRSTGATSAGTQRVRTARPSVKLTPQTITRSYGERRAPSSARFRG